MDVQYAGGEEHDSDSSMLLQGGDSCDMDDPQMPRVQHGLAPVLSPPATPVVSRHASRLDDAARAGWQMRPPLAWGDASAMDSEVSNSASKRKRTPLEGTAESTAIR